MKIKFIRILFSVISFATIVAQTDPVMPLGDGTFENPYTISSLDNLFWISSDTANWNKHYIQTENIDASVTSIWFNGEGWPAIGNKEIPFTGSYNGQEYTITGLYIKKPEAYCQGMFGYVDGGVIKNIVLTNINITGHYNVGSLIGYTNDTTANCCSSGTITGVDLVDNTNCSNVGGLIGHSTGVTINCYANINVSGYSELGGLIGLNGGMVLNCIMYPKNRTKK